MSRIAVCSIASKNFFAHARALFESVKRWHPDVDCHFLLADEADGAVDGRAEAFSILEARELGIEGFESMAFRYDVIEMNVALKPFFIRRLLAQGYERVIYFDVDILLFSGLDPILSALEYSSIVITPHLTKPFPEDSGPTLREDLFLKNGTYNLGFIAVAATDEGRQFIEWWAARCLRYCLREPETGLFVDQKWVNLVPGLYEGVAILRHPGCNMAYWNLHERTYGPRGVNDRWPLVFFHFSGVDLGDIEAISKHQTRWSLTVRPDLAPLFESYRDSVMRNGDSEFRRLPYRYGAFDNGDQIPLIARRIFFGVEAEFPQPFRVGPGTFHELLRRKGLLAAGGSPTYGRSDAQNKGWIIDLGLKILARILGIGRYEALMAYARYIAVLRRQTFLVR